MTATESQDIILYVPKSNVLTSALIGIFLPIGLAIPFFVEWQLPVLLLSLFFIVIGIWLGPITTWKMLHNPILLINAEGICSQAPFLKARVKWEEIDSIYRINARNRDAFGIDASPTGLLAIASRQGSHIPRGIDITVPQMTLGISSTNLPLPVDQLLALIRERFSTQLEHYNIDLDDEYKEGQ